MQFFFSRRALGLFLWLFLWGVFVGWEDFLFGVGLFVCCGGVCLFVLVLFLSEVSEDKPVKSVNLRAHREQSSIKRNVRIHVPILDVNELAE